MRALPSLRQSLLCLCFITTAFLAPGKEAAVLATGRHSLWKVETGGHTLYLLGSIHVMKENGYPLESPLEEAFKKAQVVAFETDLNSLKDPTALAKIIAAGACPPGKTLEDLIPAALYTRLKKTASDYELPIQMFSSMRPWMVALTLVTVDIQKQGYDPEQGVDQHFFKLAVEKGKEIVALETPEDHFGLFTALNGADEAGLLRQTLDDIDRLTPLMDQMIGAWKHGDGDALDKLMHDSLKEQPVLHRKFLLDRNERWMPKLDKLLKEGKTAVAIVGTGHLVGKGSLVELLRAKGYRVVQE